MMTCLQYGTRHNPKFQLLIGSLSELSISLLCIHRIVEQRGLGTRKSRMTATKTKFLEAGCILRGWRRGRGAA